MTATSRPSIVCATPVKNEAWILEHFLRCASVWADHIILVDQMSEDGTRDIARTFPNVRLVDNPRPEYNDGATRRLVLDSAREIPGPRVIIGLDADEVLSANVLSSTEWETTLRAQPGTILEFDWVNLLPELNSCWIPPEPVAFGFIDDGSNYEGSPMHPATRLPAPDGAPRLHLQTVKVLHYQYVNWGRMKSKQRWYQCLESLNNPSKRPIQIYRQYHHMDAMPTEEQHVVAPEWFDAYEQHGVDLRSAAAGDGSQFDAEVLDWLVEHGRDRFRRLGIWDVDWDAVAAELGREIPPDVTNDPRTTRERAVHSWLARTQARSGQRRVRWMQRLLAPAGW